MNGSNVPKPPSQRRRRNQLPPSKADRALPLSGRKGRVPKCPVELGVAGQRWWNWAWHTPQATTWNDSFLESLAARATLQDWFENVADDPQKLFTLMLKADESFGLTPKSAQMMHLFFEDDSAAKPSSGELPENVTSMASASERLKGIAGA